MKDRIGDCLSALSIVLMPAALYLVFFYAPTEAEMGQVQRIFYFHVSFAWSSFLAFLVAFIASIRYLAKGKRSSDIVASSSVEIGVAFCIVILTTGPIWAKPIWGLWWTWDPRLVTTLILSFAYFSYLIVRSVIDEETKRARFAAVIGIVAFVNVPIVYMSIQWWSRTIHPDVIRPGKVDLDPAMLQTLAFSAVTIMVLYLTILFRRISIEELRDEVQSLRKLVLEEKQR